jgi:GGDEF domain-containing protein
LSSPSYFYEQLRREILLAARTQKPLALVKILFINPESDQVRAHDVLHFAYELTQITRQEECVGRLGINEMVIIVRDGASHAELLVQRLLKSKSLTVDHTLQIKVSIVVGAEHETSLSLLARLDRAELIAN